MTTMTTTQTQVPPGAVRALDRLGVPLETLTRAAVLDDAAYFCRLEDTMPGRTGVFARASADAMELYDWLSSKEQAT
jgi:hypothetical protein